jgi:hypothetical protein
LLNLCIPMLLICKSSSPTKHSVAFRCSQESVSFRIINACKQISMAKKDVVSHAFKEFDIVYFKFGLALLIPLAHQMTRSVTECLVCSRALRRHSLGEGGDGMRRLCSAEAKRTKPADGAERTPPLTATDPEPHWNGRWANVCTPHLARLPLLHMCDSSDRRMREEEESQHQVKQQLAEKVCKERVVWLLVFRGRTHK